MKYKNFYLSLFLIILVAFNDASWHSWFWGIIFGFSYLIWHGYLLGRILFKREIIPIQILVGCFLTLALFSTLGAIFYYFYKLTPSVINLIFILILLITFLLKKYIKSQLYKNPIFNLLVHLNNLTRYYLKIKNFIFQIRYQKKRAIINLWRDSGLIAAYVILMVLAWLMVFDSITSEAINNLWNVLNTKFLLIYFLSTVILIIITTIKNQREINLMLSRAHIFLSLALAVVIYKIGYGFDPFIHRAAENVIAQAGVITPKTTYYIGQYSLVAILSHLLQISTNIIDKYLLPTLFSFFIPAFIFLVYHKINQQKLVVLNQEKNNSPHFYHLLPLTILIVPFFDFIATTPQGLANFFALAIIIASVLLVTKKVNYNFSYLLIFLGLTTLLIHPLTGIPTFIFSVFTFLVTYNFKHPYWRKTIIVFLVILTLISLPLTFLVQSLLAPHLANPFTLEKIKLNHLEETFSLNWPIFINKFNVIQDYFHLFGSNIRWLLLILAVFGFYLLFFKNKERRYYIYPLFFILMLITYALLKTFISFQSVIFYEQENFPLRIFTLSYYFLVPLILYVFYELTQKIISHNWLTRAFFTIILALLITSSLYISYPFDDAYQIGHYYSTSASDLKTVNYIEENTTGEYIVLANQSVSAAALDQFGFKKYFATPQGEIFYYPLPTASPLYQYYLDMVYQQPTKQTMIEAMDLVRVNQAYFAINNYWTDFNKIVPQVMKEADEWKSINEGKIYLFYFKK